MKLIEFDSRISLSIPSITYYLISLAALVDTDTLVLTDSRDKASGKSFHIDWIKLHVRRGISGMENWKVLRVKGQSFQEQFES